MKNKKAILVGCERFGAVRDAFTLAGHDAVSCDIEDTTKPGLHYTGDVFDIIDRNWDAGIFFPPCTHLAVSGAHRFAGKREDGRQREAIEFFLSLWAAPIPRVAIENPVGIMSSPKYLKEHFPDLYQKAVDIGFPFKATQIIQPWQFGHPEQKTTCLWLRGFDPLVHTNVLTPTKFQPNGRPQWENQTGSGQNNLGPSADRAALRGKTYSGIASAMADQWVWGDSFIENKRFRHGSLFSGIGGFDLAAEWMGWENVFHCEWNKFGQKILKYYWPKAVSYDDITKTDFTSWKGKVDILTGGFPCQPYSVAGKRKGTEDSRHLWPEFLRAIRECRPSWVVGENVPGLVNWSGGLVFEQVCLDLESEGYEVRPVILPAAGVNAPHKRDRVWFVAYLHSKRRNDWFDNWQERHLQTTSEWQLQEDQSELDGRIAGAGAISSNGSGIDKGACIDGSGTNDRDDLRDLSDRTDFKGIGIPQNPLSELSSDNRRLCDIYKSRPGDVADTESVGHESPGYSRGRRNGFKDKGVATANATDPGPEGLRRSREDAIHKPSTTSDADGIRQPGKEHREAGPELSSEHGLPGYWEKWPTVSPLCFGDDGLSARLDGITFPKWRNETIKGGGNAIVPQVAYQLFDIIDLIENEII